jgi:hypothetical protein
VITSQSTTATRNLSPKTGARYAKFPAGQDVLQPASIEAGVGNQIRNSRHFAEKFQEGNGV